MRPVVDRPGNRAAVMRCLFGEGSVSRTDLARRLGLSKVAVTLIVNGLVEQGWLSEVGKTGGRSGRPASLVDLHPRAGTVLGLDVQPQGIAWASADLRGGGRREDRLEVPAGLNPALLKLVEDVRRSAVHGPLRQVVIAVPAPVGPGGEPEAPSALPEFEAGPLYGWAERYGVQVRLDNDINLMALTEHQARAPDLDSFCLLAERMTGVGLGLILEGRLYRGPRGRAGELALVQVGDPQRPSPLESLNGPGRILWLAQTVAAHAVSLDLSAIVVHQHDCPEAEDLKAHLRAFVPAELSVLGSVHGEAGALQGAVLHACSLAQMRLAAEGFAPLAPA